MGRACDARVASMTCASTGRSSSGNNSLCRPPPMRLELPAARIIAAVERAVFKYYLLINKSYEDDYIALECYNSGWGPQVRVTFESLSTFCILLTFLT